MKRKIIDEHPLFELDVVSIRLVKGTPLSSGIPITNPEIAVSMVGKELCDMDREVLCVINLMTDGTPINCTFASMGSLNEAIAHPRELLKAGILSNAASIVMVHNHPSSSLMPSMQDTMITDRMLMACEIVGISLLDHIIVGGDNSKYFSFREKKLLTTKAIDYAKDYQSLNFQKSIVAEEGYKRHGR